MPEGEIVEAVHEGRSPLALTERTEHLDLLESGLAGKVSNIVELRGGTAKKQRRSEAERLPAIRPDEGP